MIKLFVTMKSKNIISFLLIIIILCFMIFYTFQNVFTHKGFNPIIVYIYCIFYSKYKILLLISYKVKQSIVK